MLLATVAVARTMTGVRTFGHDVPGDDGRLARADGPHGLHVLALLDRQHLGPDHPGEGRPAGDAEDEDHVEQPRADRGHDRERQQQEREGELDVGQPHEPGAQPALEIAGDQADGGPEHRRDQDRAQADRPGRSARRRRAGCRRRARADRSPGGAPGSRPPARPGAGDASRARRTSGPDRVIQGAVTAAKVTTRRNPTLNSPLPRRSVRQSRWRYQGSAARSRRTARRDRRLERRRRDVRDRPGLMPASRADPATRSSGPRGG